MVERKRLGLREIRAMEPNSEVWDAAVPGFGARRQRSEAVAYVVLFRTAEGRTRRYTIGRHGAPWTPETARSKALEVLAEARVKGTDPAAEKQAKRKAETIDQLLNLYLADAEAGTLITRHRRAKKASTLATDRSRIERHIRPLLGKQKVNAVKPTDIANFLRSVAEGKTARRIPTGKARGLSNVRGGHGAASRTVGLLSGIFTYAVEHGMRSANPVHGVRRLADGRRERRLSDDEYSALGAGLRTAAQADAKGRFLIWPSAVAAARFLAVTGWRSGEALGLRWSEVDLGRGTAILADTKTGRSMRPLSKAACDVLREAPKLGDLVFPPTKGDGTMAGFRKFWDRIAKLAGLPSDITPHVLRHSFASLAADLGFSEPTIGVLIGHKGQTITSRYLHSADAVLLAAADSVANRTIELMGDSKPSAKVGP